MNLHINIFTFQTAFNGLKHGVDTVTGGLTDAGNFVIDTAGLIGNGLTDVGHTITDTATDIGHTVTDIGNAIKDGIGSKILFLLFHLQFIEEFV